ncbi:hypothetical protein AYL99_11983 [Fonsecaea erecta]|uniref:Uncharacterized protein n=1 Tax=Fonsecaea erecta TaxID=1367422 RepID=A0A178Z334_9EURO|nr:hypothetical protein AYL99_11983 [Fonsecaea erecta]OAP53826.1 hypothetical protein AYL99_11983 [Fonsecaea erecta]
MADGLNVIHALASRMWRTGHRSRHFTEANLRRHFMGQTTASAFQLIKRKANLLLNIALIALSSFCPGLVWPMVGITACALAQRRHGNGTIRPEAECTFIYTAFAASNS